MLLFTALFVSVAVMPGVMAKAVNECGADPTGLVDSTAAFATCLAGLPSGDLFVPAGIYKIKGTVVANRNQNLLGAGSRASVLACEATASPCLVVADTAGGPNNYNNGTLQDLTIQGPGISNSSIGLYLGGDPAGRVSASGAFGDNVTLVNVRITGFNRGISWGNNAYCNKIERSLIFGNATGVYVPAGLRNSGENIRITDSEIFNNRDYGLDDHANFEWMISGTSFDYNGTAIEFFGATVHAANSHFEQMGSQIFFQPYGSGSLSIRDSELLVQANSGSDGYIVNVWPQHLQIVIDNVSIWSNHPVQSFMHVSGVIGGSINGLYGNGNKKIHTLSNMPTQLITTDATIF